MKNSLVTVCLTTYNRDTLIGDAIRRVFDQTYKNIELIIVDDYSTDKTEKICTELISSFDDTIRNKVTYLRHNSNRGLACARNTAITGAKGTFFTFIDDDDVWDTDFVESFVNLASDYDKSWCFCCGIKVVIGDKVVSSVLPDFDGSLKEYFKQGYTPPVASQFYFTESLKDVCGYDERVKTGVDHDLWLRLAVIGTKIKSLDRALAIPNTDAGIVRMTSNLSKRTNNLLNTLEFWQPTIENSFGIDFFRSFSAAYFIRERRAFLPKVLNSNGLLAGVKFFMTNRELFKYSEVLRIFGKYLLFNFKLKSKMAYREYRYMPLLNIQS